MAALERKFKIAALLMMMDDENNELFTYVTSKNKITGILSSVQMIAGIS